MLFFPASFYHAEELVALINSAYRGAVSKQGWTSEADLLDGRRTDKNEILRLLTDEDSLLICGQLDGQLVASVLLLHVDQQAQISMLAVSPHYQRQGIGKKLLQQAELIAQQTWSVNRFVMYVISSRTELIAFYERRSYQRTGVLIAFPEKPDLWVSKVPDLRLERLEKQSDTHSANNFAP
ncbi:N-acetyltransferase [Methylomonas sp. AM2-LC]|uniref:N-acetyltransferase n=1 Tax=Methylomonas sp. AM2-LC TaxID=3153301 RepID=UPI003265A741